MTAGRPRLLDLFCCAGGAAVGYHRAGFEIVGWDINPQPNYPYEFHQGDALDVLADTAYLNTFDAIHASPTCQRKARVTAWRGRREDHPNTLTPTPRRAPRPGPAVHRRERPRSRGRATPGLAAVRHTVRVAGAPAPVVRGGELAGVRPGPAVPVLAEPGVVGVRTQG